MLDKSSFILMTVAEFENWILSIDVKRDIKTIQHHNTYSPNYSHFGSGNHISLLKNMRSYHTEARGFSDIAQNITIFPDGIIAICRNFEKAPAGIRGHNTNALCIESIGRFDVNGDHMTQSQRSAIIETTKILCNKFNITPSKDSIIYHHWFDLSTGKRTDGKSGVVKSCPGTNYFGGNKVKDFEKNLLPLLLGDIPEWRIEFEKARQFVIDNKISDGTRPTENVTREEIWVMLYRMSQVVNINEGK